MTTWVPVSPLPPDFCNHPPCPLCFRAVDDDGVDMHGLSQMALDLLDKPITQLSDSERTQLLELGKKLHSEGLTVSPPAPGESPPPPADIGMSRSERFSRQLKLLMPSRRQKPAEPRKLTCDEIVALQSERDRATKEEEAKIQEAAKTLKQVMKAAKDDDTAPTKQRQANEQQRREAYDFIRVASELPRDFIRWAADRYGDLSAQELVQIARQNGIRLRSDSPWSRDF